MFAILVHKEQYFTQLKMKRHLVLRSARNPKKPPSQGNQQEHFYYTTCMWGVTNTETKLSQP